MQALHRAVRALNLLAAARLAGIVTGVPGGLDLARAGK